MADEHGKDDEEVRGQDDRTPHEPVADDLSAVQADDRLLDALGSATPGAAGSLVDDELNALLLAWRNEVETATKEFTGSIQTIFGDLGSSLSAEDAKAQLVTALEQLKSRL